MYPDIIRGGSNQFTEYQGLVSYFDGPSGRWVVFPQDVIYIRFNIRTALVPTRAHIRTEQITARLFLHLSRLTSVQVVFATLGDFFDSFHL